MAEEIKAAIERSQRELAAIRAYHQNYLDRRKAHGTRTSTDVLMEQHQEQLTRALDILEAFKALADSGE